MPTDQEFQEWWFRTLDEADRTAIAQQRRLLMRLNRAELVVLANHYGIKNVTDYTAPHDWKFGGKEELAGEIAERMTGQR